MSFNMSVLMPVIFQEICLKLEQSKEYWSFGELFDPQLQFGANWKDFI